MTDHLTIGVLAEQRYLAQSQPSGMLEALKRAGHRIILIDPEAALFRLETVGAELVVLLSPRSHRLPERTSGFRENSKNSLRTL